MLDGKVKVIEYKFEAVQMIRALESLTAEQLAVLVGMLKSRKPKAVPQAKASTNATNFDTATTPGPSQPHYCSACLDPNECPGRASS